VMNAYALARVQNARAFSMPIVICSTGWP